MTTPFHSPAEPEPLQRALLKIRDNKREAEQKNVMQHKISHRIYAFLCAVPSPPCPIPFLTWPWALWPTGDLLELKCGSWAMAWKPAGPSPLSQRLSAGKHTGKSHPRLPTCGPGQAASSHQARGSTSPYRESVARSGRQALSNTVRLPSRTLPGTPGNNTRNNNTQLLMGWLAPPQPTAQHGPSQCEELSKQWIYVLCPQQTHERLPAKLTERPMPSSLLPVRKECGQTSHALAAEQMTWETEDSLYSVCTEPVERADCMGQRGLCTETTLVLAACSAFSSPGSQSHRK